MARLKGMTKRTLRFTDVLAADGSLPTRSSRINDEQVRGVFYATVGSVHVAYSGGIIR